MSPYTDEVIARAASWATRAYPEEGCGLIVRAPNNSLQIVRAANIAPPLTRQTHYELDPVELIRSAARGEELLAIFHSHADTTAHFSTDDIAGALLPGSPPRPAYPGVDYVVYSVIDGAPREVALYRFSASTHGFVHVASKSL